MPGASTEGLQAQHSLLCRREASAYQRAALATGQAAEPLLVACTQESALFRALNAQTEGAADESIRPIHFVNLRETGGWSRDGAGATPKLAALIAAAQLPDAAPVGTVAYQSAGHCLVIGSADAAQGAATLLADKLSLSLLVEHAGGGLAQVRDHSVHTGKLQRLTGWLGQFDAEWVSDNPIDVDLCTRCNACIQVCPEGAIDFSYQVDLSLCKSHRDCVKVCEAAGAIDFQRAPQSHQARFDLVLDLRESPAFSQHQAPQGYHHVGADAGKLMTAVLALREQVGEFEKPRFFSYRQNLCAHSRNQQIGCTACIDVCSASAISSDALQKGKLMGKSRGPMPGFAPGVGPISMAGPGPGVVVEPHLCVGCGACSTVCPSGAMSFAYPGPADMGQQLRTLLAGYKAAGGRDAALLVHSQGAGSRLVNELGRAASAMGPGPGGAPTPGAKRAKGSQTTALQGLPARVIPVAVWHTASIGLDLWLAAKAQGASQIWVLLSDEEAPDYRRALAEQMAVAQDMLAGLGYAGEHFKLIEARDARDLAHLDQALRSPPAAVVAKAAGFGAQADKRSTLEICLDHLQRNAPAAMPAAVASAQEIVLPARGAPFGSLVVNTDTCTLCLSCVGACPSAALLDNPDKPQLRFIEKNCVQCGLCASTCPEKAITLQPRLWLAEEGQARKTPRVLAEAQPFSCVSCGKPFGTLRAIEAMVSKLAGHSAFQGAAAQRLKMCGDCRVIDMHRNPNEVRITDL